MAIISQIMHLFLILLLLGIQIFNGDGARIAGICGRTKCNAASTGKFKYIVGTAYRYNHKVDVSLNLGNGSSTSDLHIESVVSIKFATPCEADLRISKASIRHATRGKYDAEFPDRAEAEFKERLERYTLRFAFEDGHVHELCPNSDDAIWAINIKRGILSMLQNTMKRFDVDHRTHELDVNGICDTRYQLHEARKTSLIIRKSKDVYGCTNRGKHLSIIQSNVYASPPTRSQATLLDSTMNCEIVIDHNVYERVMCEETHRLQPLSNGDAAVKANTLSSLDLVEESIGDDDEDNEMDDDDNDTGIDDNSDDELEKSKMTEAIPTNLLYDHSVVAFSSRTIHGELRTSRDLLKSMCILGTSGQLEQSFSEAFSKFVHSARFLDYLSLSQLLARADGICRGGQIYILDALPFIGTSAAIKVMRDSMLKKIVDRERSELWMTAIALAPRPDASTVAALLPLLESDDETHSGQFTLVYSAVVRGFCLNAAANMAGQRTRTNFLHQDNCLAIKGTGIDIFLDHLEMTIERGCEPRPHHVEDVTKTLEALKAIGNMGLEREGLSEKLARCIDNTGGFISMETRLAAIDAHRRLPSCQETRDRIFLPHYRNVTLEPEIRIASYLQAMRCPDYNVVKTIKLALKQEPINQVGSFVWSHLTNLLASSSPTRIEIQSLLSDRDISDKFNSDARKYSRNYEKSFFSEEYNVGGTFQANIIFSSKSYIPRTITFNVTLDLFGESVNVLEATMRMEGMEHYVEKFFGPNGPFANEKISQHIISFLRSLRSTDEAKNYWETLKTLPNVIDNNFDDPRISLSYKIFGNELQFMMLRGADEIAKSLTALDPWEKIKRILSGREIHYEHTGMFLDASYVVASTTGLPVRLDLAGSAACNFKFSGLLDSERLIKNTEMELIGNLAPSVSVAITGKMTVDAFYKSAAIKLRSNVYSSSAMRLRLDVKGMKLVRLNLELPNRKLEVSTIRSDIVLVNGNGAETMESPAIPPKIIPMKYGTIVNSTCSWPVMERLIGLKLCFDYQFPNVTQVNNASYFFLNGPTLFRTSVIKADPSAESYLFEYSWNATAANSVLKLAFDTPGSKINRESSVTVMFDAPNRNVSVLLRSAGNSLVAKGTYKRTDDEAMINVGLDVNGTKHLDGYIGYVRKRGNFGFTYTPKLELCINNESVIELSGTIRDAHKNNVSQCDIELNFRTKKITSRVIGYIMRRNINITGNIKVEYQLRNMKKETLQIEISLANRSSKTLTHKEANLKLQSSAYPQLNAIIQTWYQQALGHLEIHAEINTKPSLKDDRHKLTAQLVLTYSKAYFQSQEAKMNAFIAVRKPIQNLDIKIGVQRFSVGPSSKTYFLIRYAPGKEISLAINVVMPRSPMLAIEGHANMTIPNFDSMLIDVRVTERARGEYDLDFAGTWFSGHNATIRGTYADRSSIIAERFIISHSLKLILRSPSLSRDILLNCKFYRDHVNTDFDIDVEYLDADKYALKFEHSIISVGQFISHAEARYKSNAYAVTANVDVEREVRLELHLDNWRDVHLVATGINEDTTKEFGIEIKWDANRDPALKFATLLHLNKFSEDVPLMSRNLSATVMIAYPGRLFTGSCLVGVIDGHNYILDGRIDWDPLKTIRFAIDADYDAINWKNYFKFDSRLLTPFEQWKKTSLNARYHWTGEELTANCDADWHDDQKFLIEFLASTQETVELIEWRANCGLTSTVHSINRINANLTHRYIRQSSNVTVDSRVFVSYNPDKVIDLKSVWHVNGPAKPGDNITLAGNLRFISPIINYQSGDIKCQLRLMSNWKFDGITNIEVDKRKYTGVLRGDLARIKESMVEFNVTTPLEKYSFVRGRFGLSERNKHVVAEIVLPSGPIGLEALCRVFTMSTYDFDVMVRLSTHIEALQQFLVVAKLAKSEADFRLAYNNATAGLTAIWHYNNLTDFHYSYVLYTPIHGLHESGIVVKLILSDENAPSNWLAATIDTEFSIRVVETKFGFVAKAGPKFSPLQMLDEKLVETSFEPEDDDFNWRGRIELNTAIIAAIDGSLDLDKRGPLYQLGGFLRFPQGVITVDDRFIFVDVFNMKNSLEIRTPFASLAEINYNYIFNIDMETLIYLLEMEVDINKNDSTPWIETALRAKYIYSEGEEDDSQTHTLQLILETPEGFIGHVTTYGFLEFDETIYKTNITIRMNQSEADFAGSVEIEEAFLEGSFIVYVNSSALTISKTKVNMKKDFTEVEKRFEGGIQMVDVEENKCKFRAAWNIESENHANIFIDVETWMKSLKSVKVDLIYDNKSAHNQSLIVGATLIHFPEQEYKLTGVFRPNRTIDIDLRGPSNVENFDYRFDGLLDNSNILTGRLINLRSSTVYLINSTIKVSTRQYKIAKIDGNLMIQQESIGKNSANRQHIISFTINRERYGLRLNIGSNAINGSASVNYINALNWKTKFNVEYPNMGLDGELERKEYDIEVYSTVHADGNTSIYLSAKSPLEELKNLQLDGNLMLDNNNGNITITHHLNNNSGRINLLWKLAFLEDMLLKIGGAMNDKDADVLFFFNNPRRAFHNVNCGFNINIDREVWRCATNVSIGYRNNENIDAVLTVRLPPPNNDDHRFVVTYHANKGLQDANFVIGYNAAKAMINYASDGSIHMAERNMDAHLRFIYGTINTHAINNILNVTFDKKQIGFKYSLYTPKFVSEETAAVLFDYDGTTGERSVLDANLYYPARCQIGKAHISYTSLSNVNGTVNVTTFLPQLPYAATEFIVLTTLKENKRFVKVFWSNASALFNSDYSYHSERLDSNLEGIVQLEIPLSTRHAAELNYGYKKRPQVTVGHADLVYNTEKILVVRYDSKGESRAGFDKDSIQITLENSFQPLGITYVNQYEYSAGNAGTNYPTVEWRRANVYRLDNRTAFSVMGESRVKTFHEGQEIELKAEHFNRTVRLRTDYHILPGEFDHNCWIALAEDAWASYKLNIINKTTEDLENQFIIVDVAYPWRNFSLNGSYRITKHELSSVAKLKWNKTYDINDFDMMYENDAGRNERERTIGAAFLWMNTSEPNEFADRQMASLSLKHPSLVKDATMTGYFERKHERVLINASVIIDYSENPDKLFRLSTIITNETKPHDMHYSYTISGKHPRTHLDLAIDGYLERKKSHFVRMNHRATYRRNYLPEETGQLFARVDSRNYQVEYHRQSNELIKHLDLAYYPSSPKYIVNGSIIDTPKDLNATGEFYFNLPDKLTWLMVNYTPDSVESLRMYGNIPDARNGAIDIWRTYERDLVVSDVSFYLRLNHSRLVTSTLKWRPNLREDITGLVKSTISDSYTDISNNVDYWKHYVRSETVNALSSVWDDAREDLHQLVDDWNNLKELDADFDRLKIYLNDSYNANDFYIKDVVAIGIYVIDEFSLRSHIESLPNILNEIWEIMGESGEAIRNSLLWIIEATKNAYKKLSEIISAILRGESIAQIASIVEKIVEHYDKFVKDLHVSFIKYVESLWAKFSLAVSSQWNKTLKMIEPIFIRILHYLEAVLWKASREVVDFLYDRRNELIKSPYFDRFTNFTQDVDKLYRDIKGNDIVTNIRKYSAIIFNFIRERYFTIVPFGNELKDLVDEIISELAELKKLPSVNYALQKVNYVYERINYFYEYFGVQAKIESAARLIHSKLLDISQTALQAESRYREAKTKFIFDPITGLMCLEQKLPMSWHAFNQTPEFQEIPEYRAIIDVRNYFATSNATFWTLYYRYRPYTDPYNWLPPFKAQAMIVGSQHFVTFDGRHYDFVGTGTYLLARDFVDNQFAVLISYSSESTGANSSTTTHKIIVSIGRQSLQLDVINDRVQFAESEEILQLPVELENGVGFVYQEDTIVTIELKKNQVKLKCNLKYDVCVIELSGWFYGKTAGLLGTMNNEPWDDTLASDSIVKSDIVTFAESWSVPQHDTNVPSEFIPTNLAHIGNSNLDILEFCDNLFSNKSSEFSSCFMVIEPQFYAEACMNVRSMSEACSLAIAYMQICGFYETYLRIPDKCTSCPMTNGTLVPEGEFRTLEKLSVPNSTDVVFIVEAKICNANIRQNRSIDMIVNQLNKELNDRGLKNNRWSLVIFGGDGVYDMPRNLIHDSKIFTNDTTLFPNYFNNIHIGNGNQDIFAAIGFASELVFRAGVSKTFILMPCSHCEPQNQTLDYSVLHQVLLEHDITLHILMDGDFNFKKQRLNKMFFGLDATKSYTRKDSKILTGDIDLRRQVKLPKSALGYCTPLSLETNGTIFSANKLTLDKPTSIKKFANVFAKRVALTADPSPCQHCECTADNDGVSHMECFPCYYPMPASVDYVSETFNEDDAMPITPDDNTEIDMDDD